MADVWEEGCQDWKFEDLGLNRWLVKQCKLMGMARPTPVQYHTLPAILTGEDCMGCAKTGSGKTAAFALPILQKLSEDPYGIFALVLTPTRELAIQIADQFRVFGKPIALKDCVVIGGMDMVKQGLHLSEQPHVVIATPGRLADLITSGTGCINLKKIKFLVLDEADRLLEKTFSNDLQTIFEALPTKRQTLLFSATLTDTLTKLKEVSVNKPFYWESKAEVATVEQLDQRYVLVPGHVKDPYLVHVVNTLHNDNPEKSILIFTNSCKNCHTLHLMFTKLGFRCATLHSLLKQRQRFAALSKFKSNTVRILIATDVASRGLDIPQVEFVINHNVPNIPKDYIHRVGRTARAGRGGMAISMVTQFDIDLVHAIELKINTKMTLYDIEEAEVLKILDEVLLARKSAVVTMEDTDIEHGRQINKRKKFILEGKDPDTVDKRKKRKRKRRNSGESSASHSRV